MKYNNVAFKITICGETHTLSEWADMYELYPSTIRSRYNTGCRGYERLNLSTKTNSTRILYMSCGAVNGFIRAKE